MATLRHYGLHVRVIRRGTGWEASLYVQRRNPMTLSWYDVSRHSEMEDYAYSDAFLAAQALSSRIGPSGYGETFPSKTLAE